MSITLYTDPTGAWNGRFVDDWTARCAGPALTWRQAIYWHKALLCAGFTDADIAPVHTRPVLMAHGWIDGYVIELTNRRGERESVTSKGQARMLIDWS